MKHGETEVLIILGNAEMNPKAQHSQEDVRSRKDQFISQAWEGLKPEE